jgi:hypothetical protein
MQLDLALVELQCKLLHALLKNTSVMEDPKNCCAWEFVWPAYVGLRICLWSDLVFLYFPCSHYLNDDSK